MRVLLRLLIAGLLFAPRLVAQNAPEIQALQEAFFASKPDDLLKHLPVKLEKAVRSAPANERRMILKRFPTAESMKSEGEFSIPTDAAADVIAVAKDKKSDERIEVYVEKKISDGIDAIVLLNARKNGQELRDGQLEFLLFFEEGEWRIREARSVNDRFLLEDLVAQFRASEFYEAENFASYTLRSIVGAVTNYKARYEDIGLPISLESLGSVEEQEPSALHASLVDNETAERPHEKRGYRFRYERLSDDSYLLTARPIEYGVTGRRSFYLDQSGTLRATDDDREADATDKPEKR